MMRPRPARLNESNRQIVEEYVDSLATHARLCRRYELSSTLRAWRPKYDTGAPEVVEAASPTARERDLLRCLADLERKVGLL